MNTNRKVRIGPENKKIDVTGTHFDLQMHLKLT